MNETAIRDLIASEFIAAATTARAGENDPPDAVTWQLASEFVARSRAGELPPPTVLPLVKGGVSVEWHEYGINIEARFRPGIAAYVTCEDASGTTLKFAGTNNARAALHQFMRCLATRYFCELELMARMGMVRRP